ncbi:1 TM domain-containing transmembrane protein [Acrasis kona]|uniref:1 TM domain-containing transmembrane protein n=1 Tax=Acrasis kona TaxID=1008807 RepID=A0AAW2ZIB7_9EUKA
MSGRVHYIDDEEDLSKKSIRCRIAIGVIAVLIAILLIAAAIVLLVIFIPKNPESAIDTNSYSPINFYIDYDNQATTFAYANLTFTNSIKLNINNKNHLKLDYDNIVISSNLGNIQLGNTTLPAGVVFPGVQSVQATFGWNPSFITAKNMGLIMCQIYRSPTRTLSLGIRAQITNLRYVLTSYGDIVVTQTVQANLARFCQNLNNKCEVYQSSVCQA